MDGQGQTRKYKRSEKVEAFEKLIKAGVDKHEAQRLSGVSVSHMYKSAPDLSDSKYNLKNPELVGQAYKAIQKIVKGKWEGAKASDVLAASKMIFDRAQPINEQQEQQAHQFIQINVGRLQEAVRLINAKSPADAAKNIPIDIQEACYRVGALGNSSVGTPNKQYLFPQKFRFL